LIVINSNEESVVFCLQW